MAVAFVRNHTAGTSTTSGTTVAATVVTANVAIGNVLVAWVGFDNLTTTTPVVSSLSVMAGETNTWAWVASHDSSNASAAAGVRGEMWAIQTTVAWTVATAVTATLSGAVAAKVILLSEFSGASVTVRGTAGTGTSTSGLPTASTSGTALVAGDLVIGGATFETNVSITGDGDTTNGSWSPGYSALANVGLANTSAWAIVQYKVINATGVQTYNPTAGNDSGAVVVALVPAPSPNSGATLAITATTTATGTRGVVTTAVAVAATVAVVAAGVVGVGTGASLAATVTVTASGTVATPSPAKTGDAATALTVTTIASGVVTVIFTPKAMTSGRPLTRVVAPNGSWTYLDQVGRVTGLSYSWTYPGGPASAECNLDVPADAHIPALTQGSRLSIHRGASEVWAGRVATVDRGAPWKIQADGLAGIATREPVGVTGTVDAIIDAAITNGLPWTRPASVSTDTWSGGTSGADLATTMLDQVLTTVLLVGGKRWTLNTAGVVSAVTDPTLPTLIIRADATPPLTLNDYATEVTARYQSSSGVYLTVRVTNAAAAAKFGRVAASIDLGYSVSASGAATAQAQAYLDRVSPRMTLAGDFVVTPGQVTTGASGPVDLAFVRPGVMARIQLVSLVRDALLVPTTSIDLLIGATKYDVDSGRLTISPVGRALSPAQIMFGGNQ